MFPFSAPPHLCTLNGLCWGPLLLTLQKSHWSQASEFWSEFPSPPGVCLPGRPSAAQERPAVRTGGAAGAELGHCPHHRWTGCAWMVWALGAASGCRAHCPSVSGSTEPPLQPRLGARRGPGVRGTKPVLGGLLPFHSWRSGATAGISQATFTAVSSCPFLNLAPK